MTNPFILSCSSFFFLLLNNARIFLTAQALMRIQFSRRLTYFLVVTMPDGCLCMVMSIYGFQFNRIEVPVLIPTQNLLSQRFNPCEIVENSNVCQKWQSYLPYTRADRYSPQYKNNGFTELIANRLW